MELEELFPEATPHHSSTQETAQLEDYESWLRGLFPSYTTHAFAEHHHEFWRWVWAIETGIAPPPFVGVWARGGAKSTSAELACVALGAREKRKYGLYISGTQDQADDHVSTIGAMLESAAIAQHYPLLSERYVGKYGSSKGWRRTRLWTRAGFIIDAVGLDKSGRGVKLEEQRPDFIVLDDIDGELDTKETVEKNLKRLSKKLLPAGSYDVAVLAIQNLVIPHGIFASLASYEGAPQNDILNDRIVSGPIPALYDLAYERGDKGYVITAGRPSWEGQSREICQQQMSRWGLTAFLEEAQHEVDVPDGGMFSHLEFRHCTAEAVPALLTGAVWVDPAVTDTDHSDACGISACSVGVNGVVYVQEAWEKRSSPLEALREAIRMAGRHGIDRVGVETDQGGDTWQSVYQQACFAEGITLANAPEFVSDKAGAGYGSKVHRASQMLADYERGRIVHVIGTHQVAERGLRRFPKTKPYDYVDAQFWAWNDCREMFEGNRAPQYAEVSW